MEFEQKAALLKRLSFTVFCSEIDQYTRYLPDIQGQLYALRGNIREWSAQPLKIAAILTVDIENKC